MEEFFDYGKALRCSRRLWAETSVSTDAGGPGVMTVDELEEQGLTAEHFNKKLMRNS
jgi:acyl-CoA synthetase (NDP forming)